MGRSYQEWLNSQDQALVAKVRAGDENNKPLLNQLTGFGLQILWHKKQTLIQLPNRTS